MKMLVAGDTHCNLTHLRYLLEKARGEGCDRIIQLGDFGFFWPGYDIQPVLDYLDAFEIDLYFLDGNHEDFGKLQGLGIFKTCGDIQRVHDRLFYLPRGCTWQWGRTRFLAVGGAVSVDKEMRMEGLSWWPQENLKEGEVRQILDKLDNEPSPHIMLCHDVPAGCAEVENYLNSWGPFLHPKLERESESNRLALRAIWAKAQPEALIHGHYHFHYHGLMDHDQGYTEVTGLSCDGTGEKSYITLEVEERRPLTSNGQVCHDDDMPA